MEEYQRAKAENARKAGQIALNDEVKALFAKTPGAEAEIKEVLQRTKGHLDAAQTNEMLLETAKRLNADYRRKQRGPCVDTPATARAVPAMATSDERRERLGHGPGAEAASHAAPELDDRQTPRGEFGIDR